MSQWLYEDALFLRDHGRLRGCLCLLLCEIDRLSKEDNPNNFTRNGERYKDFLNRNFEKVNLANHKLANGRNLSSISEIYYKEFRCYLVHEGNSRDNPHDTIEINYRSSKRIFRFDEDNVSNLAGWSTTFDKSPISKWTVDANWIIDLVIHVIAPYRKGQVL